MSRRAGRVLPAAFYARPTLVVARELLGATLVHETAEGLVTGRIVEVEAYIGESDPGCHAAAGPTPRNQPLYEAPGRAYVYLNYGVHCLLNAVTEAAAQPAAVLLRAVEPVEGLALMRRRRTRIGSTAPPDIALGRGPGNLSRAFAIDLSHNRRPLDDGPLRIEAASAAAPVVSWTRRIGLSRGHDRYWRCSVRESRAVSGTPRWNLDVRDAPRPWRAVADVRKR